MHLPPFLLEDWLAAHEFAVPPIRYNLAPSVGPTWILAELMALGNEDAAQDLAAVRITYAPPQGGRVLRERIAALYDVDPDWVVVTTGASEALLVLMCLAAESGASVVAPSPGFPAVPAMARAWGLDVKTYQLTRENSFASSADLVLAAVEKRTRLVLVNTPHNPTGAVMATEELVKLAEALAAREIPLVIDEVLHPLYFDAPLASGARLPNTTVIGDFSKALSLPGLRIGWLIERDPKRRQRMIDARSYFTVSGSPLTEAVGVMALAAAPALLSRLESVARTNLATFERFVDAHRTSIGWVRPSGGTVSFPWLLDGRNARPVCEALARDGVLVVPGDCFGAPEHFRVGFGALKSGIQDALDIASRFFS